MLHFSQREPMPPRIEEVHFPRDLTWLAQRVRAGIPTTILFVCTANYVRSPYAEYKIKKLLRTLPPKRASLVRVISGAMHVDREKDGMHPIAKQYLMEQEGFIQDEVDAHVPTYVKRPDHLHFLKEADVILGFERDHVKGIIPKEYRLKALLLSQFVTGADQVIEDPYFNPTFEHFARVYHEIDPLLETIVNAVRDA